ncbi:MAG: ribonuclease HI family protein [Syntrophorhabdaceae bacterium]|nr:ribonuclease HI family protein [Syntrophorhabdaceae bacterium]
MGWHAYIDGASLGNPGDSGAAIVVFDEDGKEILREGVHLGEMTNNMAEYEALLLAIKRACASSVKRLFVYTDSLLIANQIKGTYKVKNERLKGYLEKIFDYIRFFDEFDIKYIPREKNRIADKLAKDAATIKG